MNERALIQGKIKQQRVSKFAFLLVCVWMCCWRTSLTTTKETNTDRMTGQDVKRKSSFCSCAMAVGLGRLWASLSVITAHDPSVHQATWPESPDQAPRVLLHMPDLSLRDTALSKGIHCVHVQQCKPKHSYSRAAVPREQQTTSVIKAVLQKPLQSKVCM